MNKLPFRKEFQLPGAMRKNRLPISSNVVPTLVFFADSLSIAGSGIVLYSSIIQFNPQTFGFYMSAICAVWITVVLLFQFSGLYRFEAILRPIAEVDALIVSYTTAFLFLLAGAFAFKISEDFSRIWMGLFGLSALSVLLIIRLIFSIIIYKLVENGYFSRNIIIIGEKKYIDRIYKKINENRNSKYINMVGVFISRLKNSETSDYEIIGRVSDAFDFIRTQQVDDVVVALPWSQEDRIVDLVERLRELPVNVYLGSDLIGLRLNLSKPPDHFSGTPVHSLIEKPMSGWAHMAKGFEDYFLSSLMLIIVALPMALVALLIKLDSSGPIIFKQKRLGFNNREFDIYKFRSMEHTDSVENKTIQAKIDDPRFTRLGKWLRRLSIDELPQLFNVLKGEMSLVGPRPHALDHNAEFSRQVRGYFGRHNVKPGITGWAQVHGFRGETQTSDLMEARVQYDNYYAQNWSLWLDFKILLMTPFAVVRGENAH